MNTTQEKPISMILLISALLISFVFAVGSSFDSVRQRFSFNKFERKILAKIFSEFSGKFFVILKMKTESGINLEIYEKNPETGIQKLIQNIAFQDEKEAYTLINHDSLNLALVDINKDTLLDIICPTVDRYGNSRLNVFVYNPELGQFTPLTPDTI